MSQDPGLSNTPTMAVPETQDAHVTKTSQEQQEIPKAKVSNDHDKIEDHPTPLPPKHNPRIEIWLQELSQHSAKTLHINTHGPPTLFHASTTPAAPKDSPGPNGSILSKTLGGIVKKNERPSSQDGGGTSKEGSSIKESRPSLLARILRRKSASYVVSGPNFERTRMYEDLSCWGPAKPVTNGGDAKAEKQGDRSLIMEEDSEDGGGRGGLMERRDRLERAARLLGKKTTTMPVAERRVQSGIRGLG